MSNFIKTTSDLNILTDFLNRMRNKEVDLTMLEDFFDVFIIKDSEGNPLTQKYYDNQYNLLNFNSKKNSLLINLASFNNSLNYIHNIFSLLQDTSNIPEIAYYESLFVLMHELEHSYQYLMAQDKISSPNLMLKSCYKLVFEIFRNRKNFMEALLNNIQRYLYNMKSSRLALERNANVESIDAICKIAFYTGNKKVYEFFDELWLNQSLLGYENGKKGVLLETAKTLKSLNKISGCEELKEMFYLDKIRYGMPLLDEEFLEFVNSILESQDGKYEKIKQMIRIK